MNQSATSVPHDADATIRPQIQYRIRKYAADHPEATQYPLTNELEASELLLVIAATIHHGLASESNTTVRKAMRSAANGMRAAVSRSQSYDYLRRLGRQEFYGLEILVPHGEGEA